MAGLQQPEKPFASVSGLRCHLQHKPISPAVIPIISGMDLDWGNDSQLDVLLEPP